MALYESWAGARITLRDLHTAMASFGEDTSGTDLTPISLKSKLWPKVVDSWADQMAACPSRRPAARTCELLFAKLLA
jgi:hypothetical protein